MDEAPHQSQTDLEPLGQRLEQVVRRTLVDPADTVDALETVLSEPAARQLFQRLDTMPSLKRLVFCHQMELFAVDADFQLPFFYITALGGQPDGEDRTTPTLDHVVDTGLDGGPDGAGFGFELTGLDTERLEELGHDFADILVYFLIRWLQENPEVVALAQADAFSYQEMKKSLGDYSESLSAGPVKEMETILEEGDGDIDPAIQNKIERVFVTVLQGFIRMQETPQGATQIPDIALALHKGSHIWMRRVLSRSGISLEDYRTALDQLYLLKLIHNRHTIFWCESCGLDEPAYTQFHGRLPPSKLSDNPCPRCGNPHSFGAAYGLDTTLKEALLCKDGILALYVGWLLEKNNLTYVLEEETRGSATDYLVDDRIVVEVKMFRAGGDEITERSQLDSALGQLNKQVATRQEDGLEIEAAFLIWNRWETDQEQVERLVNKHAALRNLGRVQVLGPEEVKDTISKL